MSASRRRRLVVALKGAIDHRPTLPCRASARRWNQEQNVLAFDGSPLLTTEAAVAPDPSDHFAEFHRLSEDQATSDNDLAVCAEIIELAPELTPEGAGS